MSKSTPDAKTASDESKAPSTSTVDEHANRVFPADRRTGRRPEGFHLHQAAAALHGWTFHAHHTNQPMRLTAEAYTAALNAAAELPKPDKPGQRPTYKPFLPALSPHHPTLGKAAS